MKIRISTDDEIPANCIGTDPATFDDPLLFRDAFAICAGCQRKRDCLEQVDPARSHFEGVVGGIAWTSCRPVVLSGNDWPREVQDYLAVRPHVEPINPPASWRHLDPPVNDLKVQRFLKGLISWLDLTMSERLEAACRLRDLGFTPQDVCRQTHVSTSALASAMRHRRA